MSLAAGTKLGPYEVTAPLGVGGVGEVYRAHDARLGRDVAVKVLPPSFAADADRLRRFEQEARATSALSHPNILAIHDLGAHEGAPYVVSELLEGETLRDRIGATPLPLRKAIDFGSQVARGLAAAHEKSPEERFQSARDIAFDLEQLSGSTTPAIAPIEGARRIRFGLPLLLGGVLLALGLGVAAGRLTTQARVEGPTIERLTFRRENVARARFSPDGRSVVFESTVSGEQTPVIFTAQDGSAEARTLGLPDTQLGGISSKGELAVLVRRREGAARTLAIIPMSGGAPREVVEDVEEADWSPDGASLAVLRWTGGGLLRLEFPAGKELYTAAQLKDIHLGITDDGTSYAYTFFDPVDTLYVATGLK